MVRRVANKSAASWQQVVVMEFVKRHDTTDTTDFFRAPICYEHPTGETGVGLSGFWALSRRSPRCRQRRPTYLPINITFLSYISV